MTRTTLSVLALLLAGAACLAASAAAGAPAWWGLAAVPAVWFGLVQAGRAVHAVWVRWSLAREARRGEGRVLHALDLAARAQDGATGRAGFTRGRRPAPALERAVLDVRDPGPERDVLRDLRASSRASRRALVRGLRDLLDTSVAALGRPAHPLYRDADDLLAIVGLARRRLLFRRWRIEAWWRRTRPLVDPAAPEEALAFRLLVADMPRAALAALRRGPRTAGARRLARLARFATVLRRGAALQPSEIARRGPEFLLLGGRRVAELVPGSPFLATIRGGAAALERALRRTPAVVADLARLAAEASALRREVAFVLHRILDRPLREVEEALLEGRIEGRPDPALAPHLRGLALLEERRPREAVAEFEAALRRAPRLWQAAYALAVARRRLGEADAVRKDLRAWVERHGSEPLPWLYLARFLADGGLRDEAKAVYERAVERFPRSVVLRVAFGQDLVQWGDQEGAFAQFDAALIAAPDDARLALNVGHLRIAGDRAKDAVAPLSFASHRLRGRERAEAIWMLLSAHRECGRHEEAQRLAARLVDESHPGPAAMFEDIAQYLEERHDFVRARLAAEKARERGPM